MAVTSTLTKSDLVLLVNAGQDVNGKDIHKTVRFSKVKPAATMDDMFAVGQEIAKVLAYTTIDISRSDSSSLENN